MSSISSSNYYNVSNSKNYSSNGLSGLVSGMDTESMVKKMLSGTQTKIDKQNQAKTLLQWKQAIYQDVVSDINTFSSKYFDSSYGSTLQSNLANKDFFNTMASKVSSGSSVKVVSSSSDASVGDMSVIVQQLASAAKITSSSQISGTQSITGSAMDVAAISSAITGGTDVSFTLSLDGTAKTLTFSKSDFSGTINAASIKSVLDTKLSQAFGTYIGASMSGDNKLTFSLNLANSGHEMTVTGADALKFGITPGVSTLISGKTKLGNLTGIQGTTYSFTINGASFSFSSEDTVSGMMNKISSSNAGVKLSYSSMSDKFTMETSSTGLKYGINMSQDAGNLLSVMFGNSAIAAGSTSFSDSLRTNSISCTGLDNAYTTTGASMKIKVNDKDYTFTLANKTAGYTKAEVESELNTWLTTTFGQTGGVSNISYSGGKLNIADGYAVSFAKTSVDTSKADVVATAAKTDLALAFGFSTNGSANIATGTTAISDVYKLKNLSLLKSDGSAATTVSEIAKYSYGGVDYNLSYSNGKLGISGTSPLNLTGTGLESLFGTTVTLGDGAQATGAVAAGTDALLEINGVSTSRSSNTFTVDGITLTATAVSPIVSPSVYTPSVITTTRDTDVIVDAVKSFVSDYNTMVSKFYKLLTEDPDYRNYAPLIDSQREGMSDKQEEQWEAKAKTGLVRNDNDISTFLTQIGSAFYKTCEKAGIALYSIGIETTASISNKSGQITLDETALRKAIASEPDAVATLFTDATDGFAKNILSACNDAAKLSSASPGKLVDLAGAKNWASNAKTNEMYRQMKDIDDKLEYLKDKYSDERERYWAKFSAMEKAIASYSSQSGMLSSMTG